ncbi:MULTISPECIES: hypothetical protein [unclassified Moorena]|uniref:hypothetical protein n=1 Tax=unclassified Moorena TaxID=2683338 RepID=UPI0014007C52|nr:MULTISPECIES: hypothetical protein [unclassified Moorena]NEO14441.1 hypothetical protein [Moorena sp. SIO3E8]NEP98444.1 hypothetical protein [Moorena sp. SIO3F7]
MSKRISPPDLEAANILLRELFEEVNKWESQLAGGIKLPVGATAVQGLRQTEISFGNPRNKLIFLTEEAFKEAGVELTPIFRKQMRGEYDFYSMSLTVNLRPQPGAQFRWLCCELDFSPKGKSEPIVQTIFPQSEWRTVMEWGVGMTLGLNENLNWSVGVDGTQETELANLAGHWKANIASKNKLKGFVVVPEFTYEAGRSEITAVGEGGSTCYWYIQDAEMLKKTTVEFATVFKVPQGTDSIKLRGIAWAEANMNWLTANLGDVFRELDDRFKNLLQQKDKAARQLARGISEEWSLDLPKT